MNIGELARQTGIRASALRYYEDIGLLPVSTRVGGRRVYGEEALDRIAFVQFARACGFRLDEIAVLLDSGTESGPVAQRWRELAAEKMAEMDRVIAQAQGMKRFLQATLECKCVSADECGRIVRSKAGETARSGILANSMP